LECTQVIASDLARYIQSKGAAASHRFGLAQSIDLPLDALEPIYILPATPLIEGLEDTDHPVKWDGNQEMVFRKASQSACPGIKKLQPNLPRGY
jgi:hypothetical protein